MKLLYITNGISGAGGLERVLSVKTRYFAEQLGYTVHVVRLNEAQAPLFYDFSPKVQLHSIAVFGNPVSYLRNYIAGLQAVVLTVQPDVILVCDDGLKAFFLPSVLKTTAKLVYERHVSKSISLTPTMGFISRIAVRLQWQLMDFLAASYDRFVVLTTANTTEWPLKNLVVIGNPLSFYPDASSSLATKKVLAVGKQSYQKGYDLLLKAWQQVVAVHPDWQLEIYGTFDATQGLDALAADYGISDTIHFFPPEQDIASVYLGSSVFVLSSRYEGFGMVLIEAMACGVPCVSFDCPYGPSDILTNGSDGFLVPTGDTTALAQSLLQLLGDSALRQQMGHQAKENVTRYLPEPICAQWDALFQSLLS